MKRYLIGWSNDFGHGYDVFDAKSKAEAVNLARQKWTGWADDQCSATPLTKELAKKHGFEWSKK